MPDPSAFPVLTIGPDIDSLTFSPAYHGVRQFIAENGLRTTRARHTFVPNKFAVKYSGLTDQDKLDLQLFFEDTVEGGALSFLWFNSQDFQTSEMKFTENPRFQMQTRGSTEFRWDVILDMIEAGKDHAYALGGRLGEGRLGW